MRAVKKNLILMDEFELGNRFLELAAPSPGEAP